MAIGHWLSAMAPKALVRLPGVAPRHPPWRGGILLLNHSREIKRAGSVRAPGPCHFNKEQTPPAIYSIPARGFTAALSVFRGTPPTKPLYCPENSFGRPASALPARRLVPVRAAWAHHAGDEPRLVCGIFNLATADITWMSGSVRASSRHFRRWFRINKKPCLLAVSRV